MKKNSISGLDPKAVVVTTQYRGVFFGYLTEDGSPERVVLEDARMCVYWSSSVKGVLGLAATGPDKGSRVGPKVPKITLMAVTSISDCSKDAIEKWEAGPWN